MAMCLRSTKRALDDFTCPRVCISSSMPQPSGVAAAAESWAAQPASVSRTSARAAPLALPAVIEIEPVIRLDPAVVLEARDVMAQHRLDGPIPLSAAGQGHVRKPLEMHLIAISAAIEPDHQR